MNKTIGVNYAKETIFDYYKYYFPGWKVWIDGKNVEVYAGKPYGQIEFMVPEGKHEIKITFRETLFRGILDMISLLSAIAAVTIIIKTKK